MDESSTAVIAPMAPSRSRLPWAILVLLLATLLITVWLGVQNDSLRDEWIFILLSAVGIIAYEVVGAVIAAQAPRNPIGWLLLAVGFTLELGALTDEYLTFAFHHSGMDSFGFQTAVWMQGWIFAGIVALPLIVLLFPDGRPPTPRWRPVVWATALTGIATAAVGMVAPGPIDTALPIATQPSNPLGIEPLGPVLSTLESAFTVLMIAVVLAAVAGVVIRWRRAVGVERRQIRILAVTALTAVILFLATLLTAELGGSSLEDLSGVLFIGVFAVLGLGIPIALVVTILRFRMYDLEVVIRKTVRFAVVAVMIVAVAAVLLFAAGSTLIGGIPSTQGSLPTIVLGVLLGILVVPMWRISRRIADRLVFGGRATPYEVLTAFSERMGESYATEDVLPRMAAILGNAVGAERADVWLGTGAARRRAAGWPDDRGPTSAQGDEVPVSYQGEELGALSVVLPANDPMDDAKRSLLHDLASQAGPVLHNVRLVEDLRESRRRIVTAQDERARKLERDIHDGVQQQLVALAVKLRLADQLIDRDPARAHGSLEALQADAGQALDDLRDLARGIYPPLLADRGLGAALEAQARKAAVPTTVTAADLGRFPSDVEAAVYFCALEGLNNAAKYADATAVTVTLARTDGHLTFTVADDGGGFDPDVTAYGTGLRGMADRVEAIGGTLTVDAAPGRGVRIEGRLPAVQRP